MEISDLIYQQNPWFRDSSFLPQELHLYQRGLFASFYQAVCELKQALSLTGLKRTGKSTLLKQIIGHLLQKNVNPRHILYFSFAQPLVNNQTDTLTEILNFLFNTIINKKVNDINDRIYIFLDEIQLIPYWQDIIKRYYDINQNLKFVVSGSSTLFITASSSESLAGRIFEYKLSPLTFSEYSLLSGRNDILEFLDYGQFPEMLTITELSKKSEYLKEGIIGKVLNIDIVKTYKIRKTYDFERLFWSLLPNTGQIIESSHLMSDLGIKKATLFKYTKILEMSLLLNKVVNLSGSFRSEKRLLRKLYPASSNFLTLSPDKISSGFKAETYIASLLSKHHLYLYKLRNKEIDFVLPDKKIAMEVKFQENIRYEDYKYLLEYCFKNKFYPVVITKNEMSDKNNPQVKFIPLSKFDPDIL
jgi:uncharacterized protein